jgi:hypothetical protein
MGESGTDNALAAPPVLSFAVSFFTQVTILLPVFSKANCHMGFGQEILLAFV